MKIIIMHAFFAPPAKMGHLHRRTSFLEIIFDTMKLSYNWFHIKGTWSVHSFNGDYLSIAEGTGSCEIPGSISFPRASLPVIVIIVWSNICVQNLSTCLLSCDCRLIDKIRQKIAIILKSMQNKLIGRTFSFTSQDIF